MEWSNANAYQAYGQQEQSTAPLPPLPPVETLTPPLSPMLVVCGLSPTPESQIIFPQVLPQQQQQQPQLYRSRNLIPLCHRFHDNGRSKMFVLLLSVLVLALCITQIQRRNRVTRSIS